jgi:uncharacterized protein
LCNRHEHIAKIAALPSFEKKYYFRGGCSLGMCLEAATSAICRAISNMGIRPDKQKEFMQTYCNPVESLQQSEHYEEIEKERFVQSPNFKRVCTFLHQYSGFVYRDYNELLFEEHKKSNWITGTCMPFSKKMFVTVNGKILPCERIGHQFALGTVDKNGVRIDFEEIVQRYSRYFAKLESSRCQG